MMSTMPPLDAARRLIRALSTSGGTTTKLAGDGITADSTELELGTELQLWSNTTSTPDASTRAIDHQSFPDKPVHTTKGQHQKGWSPAPYPSTGLSRATSFDSTSSASSTRSRSSSDSSSFCDEVASRQASRRQLVSKDYWRQYWD